jgi:hypothetical protein
MIGEPTMNTTTRTSMSAKEEAALTANVAAMTEAEREARFDEIVHKPGKTSYYELLEFAKLIFG